MNRTIILFLFSSLSLFAADKWPGVPFNEVRAYAWPADTDTETVVLPDKSLMPGVLNKNGALLTRDQVKRLRAAVTGKHADHPVAACYVPHNAFVFYDARRKPVAFVEVCFACLGYRAEPKATAENFDLLALAAIFSEHRLPMGEHRDFKSFKKAFRAIVNDRPPKDTSGGLPATSGLEPVPNSK
jgi:hypothetical protein